MLLCIALEDHLVCKTVSMHSKAALLAQSHTVVVEIDTLGAPIKSPTCKSMVKRWLPTSGMALTKTVTAFIVRVGA